MVKKRKQHNLGSLEKWRPARWLSNLPAIKRPILLIRWLALLLVLILDWFDHSTAGVLFPVPQMALAVAGYNVLLLLTMRHVRWLRRPLNYLAVDTVVATLSVYLTGGYHSSFFILYVFITIGAAFYLELASTVTVTLSIGLVYIGACYMNPAGLQSPYAQHFIAAKLLLLLVVAVLCALLLEQLRHEHRETQSERALAQQLKALNDLFQKLSTTLDIDLTLQTVVAAPKTLLGADMAVIALLDDDGENLTAVAATGVDLALLDGQKWPVTDDITSAVLSGGQPYVIDQPGQPKNAIPATLARQQTIQAIASGISVPMLLNTEPLGVLDVGFYEYRVFTDEDLAFLHALGQEAALAIRNARLYKLEREQVARLRALDELQEGFVSAVSHELRTPLTCVKTSVDLLQATSAELSEEQVDMVSTIGHHVGRLETLVSDLLEITHLEAGQVTLTKQPTDLRQITDRVVEALHPLTDRKSQTVRRHWPITLGTSTGSAQALVDVDRRRIEQALTNILSNAIKFTPKRGQIDIRVTDTSDNLQMCIADNGPGIPEKDQARVFDKFYVVTDGKGLSGVGLGLYIARQMIELHGGRIWVESRLGEGSTFCFAIPKMMSEGQR